jgi:hypothetical protein
LFNFKAEDRFLTAAVVLGPQASPRLRRDAVAVLDSLRFGPQPPGAATGHDSSFGGGVQVCC